MNESMVSNNGSEYSIESTGSLPPDDFPAEDSNMETNEEDGFVMVNHTPPSTTVKHPEVNKERITESIQQ